MTKFLLHLTERGHIPDFLIKKVALFLSNRRLAESDIEKNKEKVINLLSDGVVAEKTVDANEQHYEVPPEFFKLVLGKHLKYSSGYWEKNNHSLDDKSWNYYEIWVSVLEKLIYEKDVLNKSEVSSFFKKIIDCKSQIINE